MKLLTKEIERKLEKLPLYSTDSLPNSEREVVVKFFTPDSSWTWYVLEGGKCGEDTEDWEFFGLVDGFERELGYFRLSELKKAKGPLGLPIERDLYFGNPTLQEVYDKVKR